MDSKTSARLLFLANKANQAYHPPAESDTVVHLHDDQQNLPRGFVEYSPGRIVLSFMGTVDFEDARTDASITKKKLFGHRVHAGFQTEFLRLWPQIHDILFRRDPSAEVWITGHSLGAAIATLVAFGARTLFGIEPVVATFGCPRVGNIAFAKHFDALMPDAIRVVHDADIVPRVPKFFYWHTGGLLHLSDSGTVIGSARSALNVVRHVLNVINSDVRGKAFSDHHMPSYVAAVSAFHRNILESITEAA